MAVNRVIFYENYRIERSEKELVERESQDE
jgi:hypothetical protein